LLPLQIELGPEKRKKVDKDVNDLHLQPSDAMDCSKWREMIRVNWTE